jgi:hypothetical protein
MTTITLRGLRTASPFQRALLHTQFTRLILPSLQPTLCYHRFASITTASTSTSPPRSTVNGPFTTLPAPLSLPTRQPNQSFFPTYALSLGKAYATFYKDGVKNIYRNFLCSRPIQRVIDDKYNGSLSSAISSGYLNRSDFQLLVRNWFDVKRVPVFALVLLVCGEFTPLVVIALTGVVPWTCRIPKQVATDRRKLEQRRAISFRNLTAQPPKEKGVDGLERMQLLHISWSLGLSSSAWDWLGGQLPGLPTALLRRKVGRRVQYLELDDGLIERCGGVAKMETEEVRMALVERGVDVLEKVDGQLRAALEAWFRSRGKAPVERLLLTRPSAWPVQPKGSKKE